VVRLVIVNVFQVVEGALSSSVQHQQLPVVAPADPGFPRLPEQRQL